MVNDITFCRCVVYALSHWYTSVMGTRNGIYSEEWKRRSGVFTTSPTRSAIML